MATMATNHLWMNLNARVSRYVKWRFPKLKKYWGRVASSITIRRKDTLAEVFQKDQSPMADEAMHVASELRELLPTQAAGRFASRAHLTLPLYYQIMRDTEAEIARRKDANDDRRRVFVAMVYDTNPRPASSIRHVVGTRVSHTHAHVCVYM